MITFCFMKIDDPDVRNKEIIEAGTIVFKMF